MLERAPLYMISTRVAQPLYPLPQLARVVASMCALHRQIQAAVYLFRSHVTQECYPTPSLQTKKRHGIRSKLLLPVDVDPLLAWNMLSDTDREGDAEASPARTAAGKTSRNRWVRAIARRCSFIFSGKVGEWTEPGSFLALGRRWNGMRSEVGGREFLPDLATT